MEEYRLRELKAKDCEGMLEWMKDPFVNCFYTDVIRLATKQSVSRFIEEAEELRKRKITYHFAIANVHDDYLGTISLKNIESVKGAEYAISMRRVEQGKGIASWATNEILRIAFTELKLNRVYLNVLSDNEHAINFYKRKKFRYEGESQKCILIDGKLKSLMWFAMLAEEYSLQRGGI